MAMPRDRRRRAAAAWLIAWAALPCAATGDAHRAWAGAPAQADTLELVVVSPRSWTPAVAVRLSFAGGSGDDPPGAEGTAWLLGRVLERAAREALAETGAVTEVEVDAERTQVTLLAPSSDWATAYGILARTLLTDPIDPALAEETRRDLAAQVVFQRDAPVRAFEREARRMLLGEEHARPVMGTPSSVAGVTAWALEGARGRLYRRDRARVAVVGATDPSAAASVVGAHRTMVSRAERAWVLEGAPLPSRAGGRAWEGGGRTPISDNITNSWILAAYPFSGAAARRPMEFVAHLIRGRLVTDPPAPGLISRRVEVRELPGGPALLVTVAAEWSATAAWERRIAEVVRRLSTDPLSRDFVRRQHRSFRSARALELATPEAEGRRLLAEAEVVGGPGELLAPLEGLSPEEILRTAADLGEPRILVYGSGEPPS